MKRRADVQDHFPSNQYIPKMTAEIIPFFVYTEGVKWTWLRKLHDICNHYEAFLLLLTLLLILRLPSLAEPYWYGDEGIYLAIGTALRGGARLYKDIVDHKTPLIYFFAMLPTQFWFRVFMMGWMALALAFFFDASERLMNRWGMYLASFLFVVFTSHPGLEGNIPNGELFVIGFVAASLWTMTRAQKPWHWIIAGVVAGLGVLTKVPALLDTLALAAFPFYLSLSAYREKPSRRRLTLLFTPSVLFMLGATIPVLLSILYFWMRGTVGDYLEFGLLYNFHYSGNWQLPFSDPRLVFLFQLPGKLLVWGGVLVATLIAASRSREKGLEVWPIFWAFSALLGSLLSNRPYPHYILQIVPPFAWMAGMALRTKMNWLIRISYVLSLAISIGTFFLLRFSFYPTWEYYVRYGQMISGQITPTEYGRAFDRIVPQNEKVARDIRSTTSPEDTLFIWGTNPALYALTQRAPATRFTVSFHIHDLKAYESTLQEVQDRQPAYIVVMKNESDLPGLKMFILDQYVLSGMTSDMIIYRRLNGVKDRLE